MELEKKRQEASLLSKGGSSDVIHDEVVNCIREKMEKAENTRILDVGCGTGKLLQKISKNFNEVLLFGTDYTDFDGHLESQAFTFFRHDFNQDFTGPDSSYDFIVSSEVIEHLENPRHFIRELTRLLAPGGHLVLTTPNLESYTSIISFFLRGHHSAFGKRSYPAHITPIAEFDIRHMLQETENMNEIDTKFIENGRIPGLKYHWHSILPFLTGKRFSDNYRIIATKKK